MTGAEPSAGCTELRRARELDPLVPLNHFDMAWTLFMVRHYEQAIDAAERVGPEDAYVIALANAELKRFDRAIPAADRGLISPTGPVNVAELASAYALAGNPDKARQLLHSVEAEASERYVCGYNVAVVYATLGEKDNAFAWLNRAYRDRSD